MEIKDLDEFLSDRDLHEILEDSSYSSEYPPFGTSTNLRNDKVKKIERHI